MTNQWNRAYQMMALVFVMLIQSLLQQSTFAFVPSKLNFKRRISCNPIHTFLQIATDPVKEDNDSVSRSFFDLDSFVNDDDFDDDDDEEDSMFLVKDMSNYQTDYKIDYDTDEIYTDEQFDIYARDEDYILAERESRKYVDESGRSIRKEKCILVGVEDLSAAYKDRKNMNKPDHEKDVHFDFQQSMDEMKELISTSGMECVGVVTQRLNEIIPKTYIGTGKLKEVQEMLTEYDSCTVVFDAELSPGQQKSLENVLNRQIIQNDFLGSETATIKVIDRTALILDIFAQHAKTREGKLQVDLALHVYRKPRLTKMWTHLERQSGAGGVGLRGPGESQLEIDKRLLRDRIIVLKRRIDDVQKQRDIHRRGREKLGLPVLALVGYTNAGKSTLLNYLTKAGVFSDDMLFATLDPTTRKVKLPGLKTHPEVLLTDTVGFIQKLPTQLVAAFRATLEEVSEADVLLHVIDVSNPGWQSQELAVKKVLSEIGAGDKPIVRVLNKIDRLDPDTADNLQYEAAMMSGYSVAISSLTGEGIVDLVANIEDSLMDQLEPIEVLLPYTNGKEVNMIQEVGHVLEIDYREDGTYIQARVPIAIANRLRPFSVNAEMVQIDEGNSQKDEIDWVAIGRGRHTTKDENL